MGRKRNPIAAVLLLSIVLAAGSAPAAEAADTAIRSARSGDVGSFEAGNDVDVSGELNQPVTIPGPTELPPPSSERSAAEKSQVTKLGGKVADASGKSVKTGDVLSSARVLSVLLAGMGFLFLFLKKRKAEERAERAVERTGKEPER